MRLRHLKTWCILVFLRSICSPFSLLRSIRKRQHMRNKTNKIQGRKEKITSKDNVFLAFITTDGTTLFERWHQVKLTALLSSHSTYKENVTYQPKNLSKQQFLTRFSLTRNTHSYTNSASNILWLRTLKAYFGLIPCLPIAQFYSIFSFHRV